MLLLVSSLLFTHPAFSQTSPFTFAWLSDTHVGGTTGADDLRETVEDINRLDSIAFVVISGDITEKGWNAEFDTTRAILEGLRIPVHLVPGNHDTKWTESGCEQFARVFGADKFRFRHGGYEFLAIHQGPIMRMGDGHFAPEDLRWFDSVSASIDPTTPLFFITHYPLDPSIDNFEVMTSRLARLNVQAILVGHGHANRVLAFGDLPGIMGRSNLRARSGNPGYNLVHVRGDSVLFSERLSGRSTLPTRHRLPLGRKSYEGVERQPSTSPERWKEFGQGRLRWRVETGWTNTSTPIVYRSFVYAANRGGTVDCLQLSDGSSVWEARLGSAVLGNPYLSDDLLLVPTASGYLYCLNTANGSTKWRKKTGSSNVASPVEGRGIVYAGSSGGTFAALRLSDGSEAWRFSGLGAFVESRALLADDNVIFGAWDTFLYCLDRETGRLVWRWSNGSESQLLSPAAVWPVRSGNRLFIVAPDRAATVLDIRNGREIWRSSRHQVRESAGISGDGKRFYAKLMNDSLVAYDATVDVEKVVWSTHCGFGYDIDPSMPVEQNGKVYFGTKNGLVFCLDGESGNVEWVFKLGNTIINTVAPTDSGGVVVTNADGVVAHIGR